MIQDPGAGFAYRRARSGHESQNFTKTMTRRFHVLSLCLLALAACKDTSGPAVYSTAGAWRSQGFAPATVQITLVETARSTTGAGWWVTDGSAYAFAVSGAHSDSTVSLLFDFDGAVPDITFQGRFRNQDRGGNTLTVMAGQLYGGEFNGAPFIFEPDEDPDR